MFIKCLSLVSLQRQDSIIHIIWRSARHPANIHVLKFVASHVTNGAHLISITREDLDDFTLLHRAAYNGHRELAEIVLGLPHPEVNARYQKSDEEWLLHPHDAYIPVFDELDDMELSLHLATPLHMAAIWQRVEIVAMLLRVPNIDVNVATEHDATPLHFAAIVGSVETVRMLLRMPRIDVNCTGWQDYTPLLYAAKYGRVNVTKALLARPSVNVNVQDYNGETALYKAAIAGHIGVVKALLAVPSIIVNAQDHKAAHNSVMGILLAMSNIDVSEYRSPLHAAVLKGHTGVVKVLLTAPNISVSAVDDAGDTALHKAARNGYIDVTEALLEVPNINVNAENNDGETALDIATRGDHTDVMEALLAMQNINANVADCQSK